jgi:hypothetical protein
VSRPVKSIDIGARVVRGKDWEWGDQDGGGLGTIIAPDGKKGWARVQWDYGYIYTYRVGYSGKYDLFYAVDIENVLNL